MDNQHATLHIQPAPAAPGHPHPSRAVLVLLAVAAGAGCLLLAVAVFCAGLAAWASISTRTQLGQVELVLDEFMTAMAARDGDHAYALLSSRARRSLSRSDLEQLLEGNNFVLFEGYEAIALLDGTVGFTSDSDPSAPQGTVAQVSGEVRYAGGFVGSFEAVLEREGEEWLLHGIEVSVPPAKFGAGFPLAAPATPRNWRSADTGGDAWHHLPGVKG